MTSQSGLPRMSSGTAPAPASVLPPGTQLQLMYLRERLQLLRPGRFIEIGPGGGEITRLLLDLGWVGCAYDLEATTIDALKKRFEHEISEQRFSALNADFVTAESHVRGDLVISCMVLEHLDEREEAAFMRRALSHLLPGGQLFGFVPGSPRHWGIEDDIAGHCRRYTRNGLNQLAAVNGWSLRHIAGLTFPISNMLLPISNFLVSRSERQKLTLSTQERTQLSGRRKVVFKTHFPSVLGLLLNRYTLFPLHVLQKRLSRSEDALVLYFEAQAGTDTEFS